MNTPTITIHDATLIYQQKVIFSNLHLRLNALEWHALIGPSGVGKSSLLRLIAGLTTPEAKTNANITYSNDTNSHTQIAYMAQTDLLLPWLTVLQNTLISFKLRKASRSAYKQAQEKSISLLSQVDLHQAIHLYPHQLSGGMRQRVALVRTLMEDKPIILMDEPFSALDTITRYKLQNLAAKLLKNKTVLFITHDPMEALRLANNVYLLQGDPAQLRSIATLDTTTPRSVDDPNILSLQNKLLAVLMQSEGEKPCN